ncbi:serine/threonine protein phosphatase [Psychrobacter sp. LV10R520-6]|uniref:serine/threonine protein phosphatase n=1 Tax=Psychrobacter sp. LV10R520-6 TaxID=1415574 RepID=UPI0024C94C3B|nr:TIGR01244 family protein [Psychrobacter sp. LV10R520-6]
MTMTSHKDSTSLQSSTSTTVPNSLSAPASTTDQVAASNTASDADKIEHSKDIDADNGIDLAAVLEPYFRPDEQTIVCGALDNDKVTALANAGVELVINLQPDDELNFDEAAAVEQAGMYYQQLPISGTNDLKQLKILAFDSVLRQYHGKKVAMHCGTGNRVGAAMALRAGWLRGRKMETAMERGRSHGLTMPQLTQEVHNRLLVPR